MKLQDFNGCRMVHKLNPLYPYDEDGVQNNKDPAECWDANGDGIIETVLYRDMSILQSKYCRDCRDSKQGCKQSTG